LRIRSLRPESRSIGAIQIAPPVDGAEAARVQAGVAGLEDLAHSTLADGRDYVVRTEAPGRFD
jgi:hypothetical protein